MNEKDLEKLVFGIAHQIRNPCAIILANTNVLIKNMKTTPQQRQSLEAIVNGVRYIEARLDEFLEFSKPIHPKFEPVSLAQLSREVIDIVREKCQLQKTMISCNVSEDLTLSKADPQMLLLAFLNIVLNAVESIKIGGAIEVRAEKKPGEIIWSIRDSGIGIHPRDLPEIFSPFYSTKEGGIGIGLSVSKRIIEAHGGTIKVQSDLGKGTKVDIGFPE